MHSILAVPKACSRRLVALDMGTFCDNSFMVEALRRTVMDLQSSPTSLPTKPNDEQRGPQDFLSLLLPSCKSRRGRLQVTYVTDSHNSQATKLSSSDFSQEDFGQEEGFNSKTGASIDIITYDTPRFMVTDKKLSVADPQMNVLWWGMLHPMQALESRNLMMSLARIIEQAVVAAEDSTTLLIAYPAVPVLWYLSEQVFERLVDGKNIVVLHYAPAFPNAQVPWLFDSSIASDKFRLYRTSAEKNKKSHVDFFQRIALFSNTKLEHVLERYRRLRHVGCWIKGALPDITPSLPAFELTRVCPLIPGIHRADVATLPRLLNCIGMLYKSAILITFGSYSSDPALKEVFRLFLAEDGPLVAWAKASDSVIVVHLPNDSNVTFRNTEHVQSVSGFVSYHALVKLCSLVVFTGSLCLQNTCLVHGTPMLFVPLLTEQFFWAKNYQAMTGRPFLDHRNTDPFFKTLSSSGDSIESFTLSNGKVRRYLEKVAAELRAC